MYSFFKFDLCRTIWTRDNPGFFDLGFRQLIVLRRAKIKLADGRAAKSGFSDGGRVAAMVTHQRVGARRIAIVGSAVFAGKLVWRLRRLAGFFQRVRHLANPASNIFGAY